MFKRIRLLIRGFINKYIMELEADNPEIVYDNAIDQIKRSEIELREKTAAIVRMTNELEEEKNKSLDGVRGKIKNTIAESQLARDMQNNSLEAKVRKFQKATEGLSAKQKFAAIRAQQQQKAGVASQKTL